MIAHLLEKANDGLRLEDGALVSVSPPETLFGFTYFSHMIPPVKPEFGLILGYGDGVVANLIRTIWGSNVLLTGIDKRQGDNAENFVSDESYDYICIDLWNGSKVCDFIYRKEFAKRIYNICTGLLCMNIPLPDLENRKQVYLVYHDVGFKYLRHDIVDNNAVIWWSI